MRVAKNVNIERKRREPETTGVISGYTNCPSCPEKHGRDTLATVYNCSSGDGRSFTVRWCSWEQREV